MPKLMRYLPLFLILWTHPAKASYIQVQSKKGPSQFNARPLLIGDRMTKAGDRVSTSRSSYVNMSMPIGYLSFGNGAVLSTRSISNGAYRLAIDSGNVKVKITTNADFQIGGSGTVSSLGTEFGVTETGTTMAVGVLESVVNFECGEVSQQVSAGFSSVCIEGEIETTETDKEMEISATFGDDVAYLGINPTSALYVDGKLLPHDLSGQYVVSTLSRRRLIVENALGDRRAYFMQKCATKNNEK